MKCPIVRRRVFTATSALCLVALPYLHAQTAATPPAAASGEADETIVLSPFVVDASEDANSYQAKSTLAGTRVRTDLKDVASAISVVTQQFLQDTGAKNSQDLLVYTPGTEVAGLRGNFSGQGGQSIYQEQLTNPNNTTRVRGLDSADNTRDYFLTDIPWDSYNVGRVDLQRGPNSILFGVGSPAGIINTSLNTAGFKDSYKVENVTSSYGGQRNLGDFNYVILPDQLAVRVAALNDHQRYQQEEAFNNTTRFYGAIRFDPQLFNRADSHTSFRANFENGTIKSNNPRALPPEDEITRWFQTGPDQYGNPGLNKLTINQYIPGNGNNSALVNATYNKGGFAQGRTYWSTPLSYFNGSAPTTPGVAPTPSGIPTQVISGTITAGWRVDDKGATAGPYNPGATPTIGGLPNFRPLAIANYQQYAANTPIPGGSYYADVTLSDPSIFDFFNHLLDGSNKREWQKWNAYNLALSQTFFDNRLGFELAYDNQSYEMGQVGFLQGVNYAINVDVNETLADGSHNANVGRPYVANSAAAGNTKTATDRDTTRFTVTGDLRAEDIFGKTKLAEILGHHVFTGLVALDHKTATTVSWSEYAATQDWEALNNLDLSTKISNYRQFDWVDYIGPTLLDAPSAANAHLTGIVSTIAPSNSSSVRYFNSHWNKPTAPDAPGYIDPAAPYQYLNSDTGLYTGSNESNNPANYVGWQQAPVTWLNANNPTEFPELVTGGSRTQFRDLSEAITWQGYFFNGDLAATFGWRKDRITNYNTTAPVDQLTGVTALDYATDPISRETVDGQSRTWGLVYHLPKVLTSHLPWGSTISVFYDKSQNFKADAPRTNLQGNPIPNADGNTKEYGVTFTTLDDKLSLKIGHYKTVVTNATFNVTNGNSIAGLGGNGYWLWAAPAWGYGYAAQLQEGLNGNFGPASETANNWNYAYQDIKSAGGSAADLAAVAAPDSPGFLASPQYAQEKAIVDAWLNLPVSDNYFNYFGINPSINPANAHATGRLADAFANWDGGKPVGAQQPGAINSVSTVDNISKGTEVELQAQPTKNWNLYVNYTRVDATKTNIDPATVKFMEDNKAFFDGPGGQLRLWGVGNVNTSRTQQIGYDWVQNVYNPYLVSQLAAGQSTPEVAKWRLNAVTTYTFDRGAVKGLFVGGGVRLEAGRILGYRYDPDTLSLSVEDPLMGSADEHYDLWLGYSRKINRRFNWRIQLNIRDVGESTKLVAARYQPDGVLALARIQQGMTWQLTNTIEF
jgi:hypothetical protein